MFLNPMPSTPSFVQHCSYMRSMPCDSCLCEVLCDVCVSEFCVHSCRTLFGRFAHCCANVVTRLHSTRCRLTVALNPGWLSVAVCFSIASHNCHAAFIRPVNAGTDFWVAWERVWNRNAWHAETENRTGTSRSCRGWVVRAVSYTTMCAQWYWHHRSAPISSITYFSIIKSGASFDQFNGRLFKWNFVNTNHTFPDHSISRTLILPLQFCWP